MRLRCPPRLAAVLLLLAGTAAVLVAVHRPADAYVEAAYTLGRLINESTNIVVMQVERVDKTSNQIVFRKVRDLKGKHNGDVIKHNIGRAGFHPREWQNIMEWAEAGKTAVFMHNGGASETCIGNYWYQAYAGDWWGMSHAEPYLLRSFAGSPEKLIPLIEAMLQGQEVVVPCMVDGDKNAIQLRTARIQRVKASLKIVDYDPKRDFVGWGGDDFRAVSGMPGFSHLGTTARTDPGAEGVAVADIDADGRDEFLVYGRRKAALLKMDGTSLNEIGLPVTGGARSAQWADYNLDGQPDLLLATSSGPKLLTNVGKGAFRDDTAILLPPEPYYNATAAAWIDADGDKRPDVLLANGFLGLRRYRNVDPKAPKPAAKIAAAKGPATSTWQICGPFSNTGGKAFATVYPPEQEINFKGMYTGKGGAQVGWFEKPLKNGEINDLRFFTVNENVCGYLYREVELAAATEIPASFGSDEAITVWLNGEKLVNENAQRQCAPDQHKLTLKFKPGKNTLLIKLSQLSGEFAFYLKAELPANATGPATAFEDITETAGLGPNGVAGKFKGDRLTVADVNGDGRADALYSATSAGAAPTLLLNTPKGFVEAPATGLPGQLAGAPTAADIDGDGKVDLVLPTSAGLKLYRGDGAGKFADATASAGDLAKPCGGAVSVCLTDWDKDGKPDLMVGCLKGTNRYFRGGEGGKFTEATAALGLNQKIFNSRGIGVADVNKDGSPDLLLNNEGQDSIVLLGAGKKEVAAK
jgi:hypothetical protein